MALVSLRQLLDHAAEQPGEFDPRKCLAGRHH